MGEQIETGGPYDLNEGQLCELCGKDALREAGAIFRDVYGIREARFRLRIAPSVVTRGEATLFGLDSPRMAIRAVCVNPEAKNSFVNLREGALITQRLAQLPWCEPTNAELDDGIVWTRSNGKIAIYHPLRPPMELPGEAYSHSVAGYTSDDGHLVADCVLAPPIDRRPGFKFIGAKLGQHYAESPVGNDGLATSYVRPITGFSGAACIQAAALMASAALADWPQERRHGIYPSMLSLGDVTAMAARQRRYVRMSGFVEKRLPQFFRRTGHSSFLHDVNDLDHEDLSDIFGGHVRSGCPLILSVNFYDVTQSLNGYCEKDPVRTLDHAQVLVGCQEHRGKSSAAISNWEVVLHDPSHRPFMCHKLSDVTKWMDRRDGGPHELGRYVFISVFPKGVKIPLAPYKPSDAVTKHESRSTPARKPGMIGNAKKLLHTAISSHKTLYDAWGFGVTYDETHWQLVQFNPKSPLLDQLSDDQYPLELLNIVRSRCGEEGAFCWLVRKHLFGGKTVVAAWSAQVADPMKLEDSLLCFAKRELNSKWETLYQNPRLQDLLLSSQAANPLPAPNVVKADIRVSGNQLPVANQNTYRDALSSLKVGLISSFRLIGMQESLEGWPVSAEFPAQLYVCPGHDPLLRIGGRTKHAETPYEFVGDLGNNDSRAKDVAQSIGDSCRSSGVRITSLATFLPPCHHIPRELRSDTFTGLIKLASELNDLKQGHDVRLIEIVAGMRTSSLLPTDDPAAYAGTPANERVKYFQRIISRQIPFREVAASIDQSLQNPEIRDLCDEHRLRFAIELEPGFGYALNGRNGLIRLGKIVNRWPIVRKYLGINLDVSHFHLAGIEREWLAEWLLGPNSLPINGFHFADHGIGHVSDLAIGAMCLGEKPRGEDGLAVFREWVQFAAQVVAKDSANQRDEALRTLYVEFEAAPSDAQVQKSVDVLHGLLSEMKARAARGGAVPLP